MAECYRCGKKIEVVVYCPYCGAKQRSSIEMYNEEKKATQDTKTHQVTPAIHESEKTDIPPKAAEALLSGTKEKAPLITVQTPESAQAAPAKPSFIIGKDVALWIVFAVVFIAFILAVVRFWQDIVIMP